VATELKVVTGDVRLSYANLLTPRSAPAQPGQQPGPPKYSAVLLIPKGTADGKATIAKIKAAQDAAIEQGKSTKFGGLKVPADWRNAPKWTDTLHDGDTEADLDRNPEYAGHYYISVSANETYPPNIVDRSLNKILDASEVYSGMWGRVSIVAYPFNSQGNKGVSFGLRNVQKTRDDEPFGGVSRAEDDFEAIDGDDEGLI
jgi:hypothetical protein